VEKTATERRFELGKPASYSGIKKIEAHMWFGPDYIMDRADLEIVQRKGENVYDIKTVNGRSVKSGLSLRDAKSHAERILGLVKRSADGDFYLENGGQIAVVSKAYGAMAGGTVAEREAAIAKEPAQPVKPAIPQEDANEKEGETKVRGLAARRARAKNAGATESVRSGSDEQGTKELGADDFARQDQEYQQWKARAYSVTEQLPFGLSREDFQNDTSRVFLKDKIQVELAGRVYKEDVYKIRNDGSTVPVDIFGMKDIKKENYTVLPNKEHRGRAWDEESEKTKNINPFKNVTVDVKSDMGGTMKVNAQYALQQVEEKISKAEQVMQCLLS
jgi:hypothetical protein